MSSWQKEAPPSLGGPGTLLLAMFIGRLEHMYSREMALGRLARHGGSPEAAGVVPGAQPTASLAQESPPTRSWKEGFGLGLLREGYSPCWE